MISFFLLCLPIFGVVAIGRIATRAGLTASSAIDVLGAFSFRFALPALVVRLIAGQPLETSFNAYFYAAFLACGFTIFALVFALSRFSRPQVGTASAYATTASVSNFGFLGPPLMLAFFGDRGAGPLAMAIMAEVMVLMSLGSLLMREMQARIELLHAVHLA
jgi:predicted permease